jgi:PTH2 family peptidyl-tRNA hydrolase
MLKQVIVIRKDLNMRKGKMVAQGSHASLMAFLRTDGPIRREWMDKGQTKICVSVDSEEELLKIFEASGRANLPTVIVRDAGHTELEPGTLTAIGIGPAEVDAINEITGKLKLL